MAKSGEVITCTDRLSAWRYFRPRSPTNRRTAAAASAAFAYLSLTRGPRHSRSRKYGVPMQGRSIVKRLVEHLERAGREWSRRIRNRAASSLPLPFRHRIDLRQSARAQDRRRECAEPLSIPRAADGPKCCLIRSTALRPRRSRPLIRLARSLRRPSPSRTMIGAPAFTRPQPLRAKPPQKALLPRRIQSHTISRRAAAASAFSVLLSTPQ